MTGEAELLQLQIRILLFLQKLAVAPERTDLPQFEDVRTGEVFRLTQNITN